MNEKIEFACGMRPLRKLLPMLLRFAAMLAIFSSAPLQAEPVADWLAVSGSAAYRQRIAMPPEAVLTVRLEDVSRADALAVVLAESSETFGARQVPIAFLLKVPVAAIDPRSNYAVRATITVGGELRFTTTRSYAVLTRGAPDKIDLLLDAVRAEPLPTASADLPATDLPASLAGFELPATFAGIVPCADCSGIAQTLTLRADGLYRLRRTYLGKPGAPFAELGRWTANASGKVLTLRSGTEMLLLAVRDDGSLRLLDRQGQPLRSVTNLDLRRSAEVDPISEILRWRGELRYLADAATFTDCASGMRWSVAMTEGNLAMERDYLQARSSAASSLLVQFDGRLELRPAMEGAPREQLVVERFDRSFPGASCDQKSGKNSVPAELKNTYWKLIELNGQKISMAPSQTREMRISLSSQNSRLIAFGGCNNLNGGYVQDGSALRFTQMAATLMACDQPLMELEGRLVKVLAATSGFRIEGQQLILLAGEQVVARFDAVYLR